MKTLQPSDWPSLLSPGARIYASGGATFPQELLRALREEAPARPDLECFCTLPMGELDWLEEPASAAAFTFHTTTIDSRLAPLVAAGKVRFTPGGATPLGPMMRTGALPVGTVLLRVSPPDAQGFVSLGPEYDLTPAALSQASKVVAEINPNVPRTYGQPQIPVSRLDAVRKSRAPLLIPEPVEPTALDHAIARHAALLVPDGATLAMGVGRLTTAWGEALRERRHLGVHSPILSPILAQLFRQGIIDNREKGHLNGQMVTTRALGDRDLYAFLDQNPHVCFQASEELLAPGVLASLKRLTAFLPALAIDLSGETLFAPLDAHLPNGFDNPRPWIEATRLKADALALAATPSVRPDGCPAIVPVLEPTPHPGFTRGMPSAVTTENGTAHLHGRSARDRALGLIAIADPSHQEPLQQAAHQRKLLEPVFQIPPPWQGNAAGLPERVISLRDGSYLLRALRPADAPLLQEFFYSHNEETIHRRYGFTVRRMGFARAWELVAVNQNEDLALGVFETSGASQILHAVGRYYRDKDERGAEIAFVTRESKRRVGMARALLVALIEAGQARGLDRLWAQVDRDNTGMLKLFHQFGARGKESAEHTLSVFIPLHPDADPEHPEALRYASLTPPPEPPAIGTTR